MPGRHYPKRQKITTVVAAAMTSDEAASRATGIPARTIGRWRDDPEMSALVSKTRDELAEMAGGIAVLALEQIRRRIGEFEPRDLVTLYGVGTDKSLLLSGGATSRSEVRDISGTLADSDILDAIRAAEQATARGGAAEADPSPAEG